MNIKVYGYNSAPTAKELEAYIIEHRLHEFLEVADSTRTYWQNDVATLVLRIKEPGERLGLSFDQGVALALLAHDLDADEFNKHIEDYRIYYRIWWD